MFKEIMKSMRAMSQNRNQRGGGKGKGFSGTCIRDTQTKPKVGRIEGGKWRWLRWGGEVEGKWRQLYLNNDKKS